MKRQRIAENTREGIDAALADFTTHMRHKLLLTRHRPHWAGQDIPGLVRRIEEETQELVVALATGNRKDIVQEAADVANFCLMVADNAQWGGTRKWNSSEGT